MVDGIAGRPFSAHTIEPYKLTEDSHKEKIIKLTRERYGIERRIVEDKIKRWMGGTEFSETFQSEQTVLYDAICSSCGKKTKLTFKPEKGRPVYCKQCLKNLRKKKEEAFSLKETEKLEPVSFFRSKKTAEKEKPKREKRKVDIEELKKNLKKALKKEE